MRKVPRGHHATLLLPAALELGADKGSSLRAASQGVRPRGRTLGPPPGKASGVGGVYTFTGGSTG